MNVIYISSLSKSFIYVTTMILSSKENYSKNVVNYSIINWWRGPIAGMVAGVPQPCLIGLRLVDLNHRPRGLPEAAASYELRGRGF